MIPWKALKDGLYTKVPLFSNLFMDVIFQEWFKEHDHVFFCSGAMHIILQKDGQHGHLD